MSRAEARRLAAVRLQELREQVAYRDLLAAEGRETRQGRDGKPYTVQTQTWIEDGKTGEVRVTVSVDDGGWSAWFPVSDDCFVTPPSGMADWVAEPSNAARLVGAAGEVLEIRVPGREGIGGDTEGPLWLRALVIVSVEGFSAEVPVSLTGNDVAALTSEWRRTRAAGTNLGLWFVPLEPEIVLHLVHEDGLTLYGRLMHPLGYGNILTFSLRTDEEALAAFLAALGAAAEAAANSPTPDLRP